MKRLIPFFVAVFLIIAIIGGALATGFFEKYTYSSEKANLQEYFGITKSGSEVAIVLNDELIETKALYMEGEVYFPFDFVDANINNHFYYDQTENLLLFTNATDILESTVGTTDYTFGDTFSSEEYALSGVVDDMLYISAQLLRKVTNYSYELYGDGNEPYHLVLTTTSRTETHAKIKKDTQVRVLGGVKSPILCQVEKGDEIKILDQMEDWCKVVTTDGYIGYVENKKLESGFGTVCEIPNDVPEVQYTTIPHDGKICLVWNMVTNTDANNYADGLLDNTKGVNVISPTWFALKDNYGNFSSIADASYVSRMHARGIQVWGLIDNFTNDITTAEVVNVTTNRRNLISQLINTSLSYGLDGINVDFENVTNEAAAGYIQFIRELSTACRKNGLVLSVDNSFLVNYSRAKQGEVVDYVIIMGYDEHIAAADGVGSSASIGFVQTGIERTLEQVPANKVINAIPFYTRLWKTTGDIGQTAYGMSEIENFLNTNGVSTTWDEETCQYVAEFSVGDQGYAVWLEEKESLNAKLSVMSQYDLAGVAGWRLGQEKSDVWDGIAAYLAQ